MTKFFKNPDQNGSASDGPIPRPMISRRPSAEAATAIIAATETMRPAVPDLEVGRVEPQIRPLAVERAVKKGVYPLVDVFAQFRDLAL